MKSKSFFLIIISILVLSSCSCPFLPLNRENKEKNLKTYTPDVQWKYESNLYRSVTSCRSYTNQYDKYLYFFDCSDRDADSFCITKLDLDNGTAVWHSDSFYSHMDGNPIKCGDYIVIEDSEGKNIYCFSDSTGKLMATLTVGETEEDLYVNSIVLTTLYAVDNKYLIWSNGYPSDPVSGQYKDRDFGIYRVSVDDIDLSNDPAEKQLLPMTLIYKTDRVISTHFTSKDKIVYFQTSTLGDDDPPSFFGAIDVESGELLWKNTSTEMKGRGKESLIIINDEKNKIKNRLYSFEYDIGCYNLDDGSIIWEKIQTESDLLKEPYLGGLIFNVGVTYSNGYFYYTTLEGWSSYLEKPENLKSNIKCINAKTGKFEWGYMPKDSGSLSTRPIVANGKVFVLTDSMGLYVFNAKTGEVIGVDETVLTDCYEKNACWNGNVIYFDFSSGWGTIYAIKP